MHIQTVQLEKPPHVETIMTKLSVLGIIVGTVLVAAPISVNWPSEDHALVTLNNADARVGQRYRRRALQASIEGLTEGHIATHITVEWAWRT